MISVGCEKEMQPLTLGSEEALHSVLKSESAVENLLVNPDFTAPAPTVVVHQVENGSECAPVGSEGLYWTEWLPNPAFSDVGNENLFNLIACDGVPWISYGDPVSIPGWMYTAGEEDGLTYGSFFDYYTPSNQIVDLGKGNRLWQEIDNSHGAVVYYIEYAWAPTFGRAGEAIVSFNQEILATHNEADYGCSIAGPANCSENYNHWADAWDFGGEPDGNTEGLQTEKYTIIVPSGNTKVTIAFEGTDGWFFPWAAHLEYFGIVLDRVSVSAPAKVKICHMTGNNGNWHTIEIANNQSVLDHLNHNDHIYSPGSCDGAH